MSKAGEKLIKAAKEAVVIAKCEHDPKEVQDSGTPLGFEAWSCKKCGVKFYIPKYEAV
mgnify:FL=1